MAAAGNDVRASACSSLCPNTMFPPPLLERSTGYRGRTWACAEGERSQAFPLHSSVACCVSFSSTHDACGACETSPGQRYPGCRRNQRSVALAWQSPAPPRGCLARRRTSLGWNAPGRVGSPARLSPGPGTRSTSGRWPWRRQPTRSSPQLPAGSRPARSRPHGARLNTTHQLKTKRM